jgi:MFS family permease
VRALPPDVLFDLPLPCPGLLNEVPVDATPPEDIAPPEPPGKAGLGSAEAWRNVAAAFLSTFVVFGVAYSFGTFFEPMAEDFSAGNAAISLVFAITSFAYFMLGPVTGPLVDRFGPRPVLLAGAVGLGVGLTLTSMVEQLWLGYVTYGLGIGIAVACGYVPMVAVVGAWFDHRRGTALGIAVAGIGVGTLVVAPLAAAQIVRFGWRATYLQFAVAGTVLLVVAAALSSKPPARLGGAPRRLRTTTRSPAFAALYGSMLLMSMALFVPFVYLPPYAVANGASRVAGGTLVGLIGMSSVVGRLGLGVVADRFGRIRVYRLCFVAMAASFTIWLVASDYPWLVVFALLFGVGYGGFIALNPAVVAEAFGVVGLGAVVGILYTSAGIGSLIGPPLAGAVIDATGTYTWAILGAMAAAVAAAVVLVPLGNLRTSA